MTEYTASRGLSSRQLSEIRELEQACLQKEKLCMKLNYDMLEERSDRETNDFLCYDGGVLAGYLGLYWFKSHSEQGEITGMVRPEYRRRGIFAKLFKLAKDECKARGIGLILLIAERDSEAGRSFALSAGGRLAFSEYRMVFREKEVRGEPGSGIGVRKAGPGDWARIAELDEICFGRRTDAAAEEENGKKVYLAELSGVTIGKIGLSAEDSDGYIGGFCIDPAYRKKGHGRSLMLFALDTLIREGYGTVKLEAESKNDNAVGLYESCGFKKATVYDYYEVIP
jgi:ribosomal protein S18 acetylase RimI-like enzyme